MQNSKINWINLTQIEKIDEIINQSNEKPALIFKHSTRCHISKMVLKQFENEYNLDDKMECYFLDLLEFRPISKAIAERFNIEHQSPQIILIKNGKAIYNASHESIAADELEKI